MENVRKIIFFVVVLAVIVGAGFFLWNMYNGDADLGIVFLEDFEITESNQNKIISHKSSGFKMTIPADWEIGRNINGIYVASSNMKINPVVGQFGPPFPESGCVVEISIIEKDDSTDYYSDYQYFNDIIDLCREDIEEGCGYSVVMIDNEESLEKVEVVENDKLTGNYIEINIPKNNNVYTFETYLSGEDQEKCQEEFDKILGNVEIK